MYTFYSPFFMYFNSSLVATCFDKFVSLQTLLSEIDRLRGAVNLSSTSRVFVLTELLKRRPLSRSEPEDAVEAHPTSISDY